VREDGVACAKSATLASSKEPEPPVGCATGGCSRMVREVGGDMKPKVVSRAACQEEALLRA
jgi:hypothetical protein